MNYHPEFDLTSPSLKAAKRGRGTRTSLKLGLGTLSLAAFMASKASAQTATNADQVDLNDVDGVSSSNVLADGSLEVTLENGETFIVQAGDFSVVGGEIIIDGATAQALASAAGAAGISSSALLFGAAAVAAGAVVAISESGSGDDAPATPPAAANTAPTLSLSSTTVTVAENATAVPVTVSGSDADAGDTLTYTLSGADAAAFNIDAATGQFSFATAPDFEAPTDGGADNSYDVTVTVSDGTASVSEDLVITVGNENDNDPVFTSGAVARVDEGQTATDYTAAATDADGDTVTYSITGGADAALFAIDAATGALTLIAAADADAPNDANGDGIYDVEISANDGTNSTAQTVAVTLNDVNEAPVFGAGTSATVVEGTTQVGVVASAADPEGGALTYSLGTSGDSALFTVDAATGALSFVSAPDFENPTDGNGDGTFDVELIATDPQGLSAMQTVTVTVSDGNEAPVITSAASVNVDEGSTTAFTATATDGDANDTLSYSIVGGADASRLTIDASTGVVSFAPAANFEAPSDGNSDNVFEVRIRVTDSNGLTDEQDVSISLQDINDESPVFSSSPTVAVDEGAQGAVYTAITTDIDSNNVSYQIAGGLDGNLFSINSATGALSFTAPPDFENPTDGNMDNVYQVNVQASDGTNTATQTVTITVNDVDNESAPNVTSAAAQSFAEDTMGATVVFTVAAQDPDAGNAGLTYAITGGADAGLFTIDPATGDVALSNAQDFEMPGDAGTDGVFDITVSVTDQPALGMPRTTDQNIQITLTNVDDVAPVFTSAATASVAENQLATGYSAAADNTDGQQSSVVFTITGGADSGAFVIDSATGELSFDSNNAAPDFEAAADSNTNNAYEVEITATDASGLTATQLTTISVIDVNDNAPAFSTPAAISIDENDTATGLTPAATDADPSDTVTVTLSTAGDSALFQLNAMTGELEFIAGPDFENPADGNTDNVYEVELIASDGTQTTTQTVSVAVNDRINELSPVVTSPNTGSVDENSTGTILQVTATDGDPGNQGFTYAVVGGADSALFSIDANGNLSFNAGQDADATPSADANQDGTFEVEVEVTDSPAMGASRSSTQTIMVTLDNLDDRAPVITNIPSPVTVAENTPATQVIFTANAINDDAVGGSTGVVYSLSGLDSGNFTIDANTGEVRFVAAPDFEAPTDASTNNIYGIRVEATDPSGQTSFQNLSVLVTNANDQAPVFSSAVTANVDENSTADFYTAVAADNETNAAVTYSLGMAGNSNLFSINANTGALSFTNAADAENGAGSGANNNDYTVEIIADDGSGTTASQTVMVTVNDLNDNSPAFGAATAAVSVDENTASTGYTASAMDADLTGTVTYSITGGADQNDFTIDANTGALSFANNPNFEMPVDANTDNEYIVEVTASDGINTAVQTVTVTVDDVDPENINLADLDGNNGFRIIGEAGDALGGLSGGISRVPDGLGDLDGDGFDDFILGSSSADPTTGQSMGVAGILFGTDVAPAATVMGIPTIDFQGPTLTIQTDPTTITASVGNFTKNLGDINGDGFDDFAIVDSSFGETYIWTAGADQLVTAMGTARTLADLFANTNNGFIFGYGGNRPQYSVETVGDVNGDGFDDFMVTTTANDILVYGASSFATTTNANGYEVYDYSGSVNTTANNYAEFSASQGAIGLEHKNIGDINGDGFDDFALGFAGDDLVGFTNNGSARIVFGSGTDFTGVTDLDTSSDLIIQGDSNTDRVGVSITNIGDFNGDGVDDFAVGAHTADDANGDVTGVVAIFFGSDTLTSSGTPVTFADADILIEGNVVNGEFGEILAGVGDFNGDGLADLAIGEELGGTVTNSTSDEAGQYYVLYGSQTLTGTVNAEDIGGTVAGVTGLGQTAGDRAATVADIGDVNGDGFADLAVGSALNADGGANAGSVYVVYGVEGGGSAVTIDEVGGPATDDAYIGSSTVDSIDVSEGDDYVSSGAGDDSIGVYGVYQDQNLNGAMSTTNRSVLADGGGGIDTLVLGRSAPGLVYFNLTDSTESIGALSFDPSQIETRNIERLGLDDAASVIIDITTVTSLLGQNIDGVRTLVIDYAGSGSNSSIFIADEADWSDNGTTTFEGTLYNLFVHSPTGAELYIQTGSNIGIFGTSLQNLKGAGQGKVSFVDVPLFEEEPIAEPVEASDEVAAPGLEDGPSYGFDLATQDEDALLIGVSEMLNAPVDLKDYLLASKEIGFEDLKRSPDDSSKAIGFEDLLPSREDEEQDIGFEDLRPSREDSDADIGFEDLRPSREGSDKDIGFEDLLLSSKDGANGLTSHATPADITSGETALGEADAAALKADLSDVQDQFVLDAVLAGMNETPVSAVEFSVSGQEAQVATFALENVADDLVYDEIGHDFA